MCVPPSMLLPPPLSNFFPHFLPHLANNDLAEEAADVSVTSTIGVDQLLGGHLLTQVWGGGGGTEHKRSVATHLFLRFDNSPQPSITP